MSIKKLEPSQSETPFKGEREFSKSRGLSASVSFFSPPVPLHASVFVEPISYHKIFHLVKRKEIMKRKQHLKSFLSVCNKRLLSATDMHGVEYAGKRPSEGGLLKGVFCYL